MMSPDKLLRAKHLAEIAQDIYEPVSQKNSNWRRLNHQEIDKLGLNSEKFARVLQKDGLKKHGLKVGLYNTKEGELVVAFQGTSQTGINYPTAKEWLTNLKQALGVNTRDYKEAIRFSEAIADIPGPKVMVGHSKGGALASLAAAINGSEAVTFNTAGIHKKTMKRADVNYENFKENKADKLITNFVNTGEILQKANGLKIAPDPLGPKIEIGDKALEDKGSFKRHGMDLVIKSLDEALLHRKESPQIIAENKISEIVPIDKAQKRLEDNSKAARKVLNEGLKHAEKSGDTKQIIRAQKRLNALDVAPALLNKLRLEGVTNLKVYPPPIDSPLNRVNSIIKAGSTTYNQRGLGKKLKKPNQSQSR